MMIDVQINDQGTVVAFIFTSINAKEWAKENLQTESWQWLGDSTLAVDHRFANDIISLLQEEGFVVE